MFIISNINIIILLFLINIILNIIIIYKFYHINININIIKEQEINNDNKLYDTIKPIENFKDNIIINNKINDIDIKDIDIKDIKNISNIDFSAKKEINIMKII